MKEIMQHLKVPPPSSGYILGHDNYCIAMSLPQQKHFRILSHACASYLFSTIIIILLLCVWSCLVWCYIYYRIMIRELVYRIHNRFKTLLKIFYSDPYYCEIAEKLKTVYSILKIEEHVIQSLKYDEIFDQLKSRGFFTKYEEVKLCKISKEVKHIIETLKDKDLEYFTIFLSCLKESKKNALLTDINRVIDGYPTCSPDEFMSFLQKRYTSSSFTECSEVDFNFPVSDDINIALIEVSEEEHMGQSSFFDYYSLLLKQKGEYRKEFLKSYSDIVIKKCRVVLIQGYPGSGKTFLAKRMCTKWANGELLQSFIYVIFLQLRNPRLYKAKTFGELMKLYMGSLTKRTIDAIYKTNGRNILIILEGWDELPESERRDSLFTWLISGDQLPEAVIVITSRPSAIRSLKYKYIKRRIEILGFTKQQVEQNVTRYFHSAKELARQFRSELKRLPLLECFVFVPINLCVALYIFTRSEHKLPETFTAMYTNMVLIQLRRYQTRELHGTASIDTLQELPPEIKETLEKLSKMAFDHLQNNLTLTFDEQKIRQYCFNSNSENLDNFDGMGLLHVTNHKNFESISKTYEFIHRTLQELLAAWYLSQQSKQYQQKQLQMLFDRKEFEMIWIFYAGLTKFSNITFKDVLPSSIKQKIKMFGYNVFNYLLWLLVRNRFIRLYGVSKIMDGFFGNKQYSFDLSHCISREFQTTLIAAVMEAQTPRLCKEVCESYLFCKEPCWFYVPESAATPQILSALSYCIAHSGKKWMLHGNGLDSSGADYLLKYLTCSKTPCCRCNKCQTFSAETDSYLSVFDANGSQNKIDGIMKLAQTQKNLQWIVVSYCKFVDDKFVLELAEVLADNTSVKMLHLLGCKLTPTSIRTIADLLTKNKTLEWIGLKNNMENLTEKDIVVLLQKIIHSQNDAVYMMFLDSVFYTSDKVQSELKIINDGRQKRGVDKLCLALLDCFTYNEACQRFISKLPFVDKKVSAASNIIF